MKKILAGLVIFSSIFVSGCSLFGKSQTSEEPPVVIETPPEVSLDYYKVTDINANLQSAKDRYNLANGLALKWQADAVLLLLSTRYVDSLSEDGAVDRFLFSSNIQPDVYFAIDIARDDLTRYTRNLIYVEDYALKSGVMPIPMKYFKTTSSEALEIADSMGGAQFRSDNPNYEVTMVLSLAGGNNLAWYVVYSAPGIDSFEVIVNANDRTIISND